MKKSCRLVDISYNYNLIIGAYWHLQFTRPAGLLMTAALRKRPVLGIAEINSKHNQLLRSQLQQVNFPHIIHAKEKRKKTPKWLQDKMLNIPNYYRRNANLKDDKKSNPTCQNGHPHKSTNNKCSREPDREETSLHGQCEWTVETAPRKDNLLRPETKVSKGLSPLSDIPTPGPVSWENHQWKRHRHPITHYNTASQSQDTEPARCHLID